MSGRRAVGRDILMTLMIAAPMLMCLAVAAIAALGLV